jgi:transposase
MSMPQRKMQETNPGADCGDSMLRHVAPGRIKLASRPAGSLFPQTSGTHQRHIMLDEAQDCRYVPFAIRLGAIMTTATRRRVLEQAGLLHPRPEAVTVPLFDGREPFFFALDKVQVKYEMLRAHVVGGLSATAAAEQHGYSRAAFYLITTAFDEAGMRGLLDEPRGRRGPLKLTPEVIKFVASADPTLSGAQLVSEVEARFGVRLHRRTIERARR